MRGKAFLPVATFRSGRVPTVSEASPYGIVGVSPSPHLPRDPLPPYAGRDVDHRVEEVLGQRRVALLVGESKAGKTRTAFEAVRRVFPGSKLLVPAGGTRSLAALVRDPPFDRGPDPPVLWLDELDRYLGDATGFDAALLDWVLRRDGRMVIVATIGLRPRDALLATDGEIGRPVRLLLQQAEEVLVPTALSAQERTRAERLYPGERFVRGIGEHLAGAPALERGYDTGRSAAPVGWALVQAAVDWRRTGLLRAVPEADLRELSLRYVDPGLAPGVTAERQAQGLAWACRELAPGIALLQAVRRRRLRSSLRAFDHVVAYADRHPAAQVREIPQATWDLVLAKASPEEAVRIGFSAYVRGNGPAAEAAWSGAGASRHRDATPRAAEYLRMLRRPQVGSEGATAGRSDAGTAPPTRGPADPGAVPAGADSDGPVLARLDRLGRSVERLTEALRERPLTLYEHELPQMAAAETARRTRADVVALLLDNGDGALKVSGAVGLTPTERRVTVRYDHGVMRELFRDGVGLIEDTERAGEALAGIPGGRASMLLMVPLVHQRQGFGALLVGRQRRQAGAPTRRFSDAEVRALVGFAEVTAASLRTGVLLRRLRRRLEVPRR
jgi:hypothetical protein